MAVWTDHPQHHRGFLYLDNPPVVFKARADFAGGITYPLAEIPFDTVTEGAYTDVEPGMLLLCGSTEGADDLGRTYIRKWADADTLFINWSSENIHDGEVLLYDTAYLTVVDTFPVYAKSGRILSDGTIYKDYDLPFYGAGDTKPPIVRIGGGVGWIGFVDPATDVASLTLTAVATIVEPGATITTYTWSIGDCSLTAGSLSGPSITVSIPVGRRWIKVLVTDSHGAAQTRRLLVVADDPDNPTLLIRDFEVDEQTLAISGQTIRFAVHEAIPQSSLIDGTVVMYFEEEYIGTATGSLYGPTGFEHIKFTGWHQTDRSNHEADRTGYLTNTTLECLDAAGRLATLPGFSQTLAYAGTPGDWQQTDDANVDIYFHYLLKWHSSVLDLTDFTWSGAGSDYPFAALGSDGQSLYDQVDKIADAIGYRFTCDSYGRLFIKPDPCLQDQFDRTATVMQSLDEDDWEQVSFEHHRAPRVHWLRSYGLLAQTSAVQAVQCIAPGSAPGQGEGQNNRNEQLVIDQTELNAREGHRYARVNAPESTFDVTLVHGADAGIEPATMQWVQLTLSADYAAERGLTWTNARFLVQRVEINHRTSKTGNIKQVRLELERETLGHPAETVYPNPVSVNTTGSISPRTAYPRSRWTRPNAGAFQLGTGTGIIGAISQDGYVYQTSTFLAAEPVWARKNLNVSTIGVPLDWCVDAWSPKYVGGGSQVNGWLTTTKGIYRVTDLHGTPAAVQQHAFQSTLSNSVAQWAVIEFGWGAQNWGVCIIYYKDAAGHTGTWETHTTDGTNWSAEQQITAHYENTYTNYGYSPGIFCSSRIPGMAYTSALTATTSPPSSASYYKTIDYGLNWSQVSSPVNFNPVDSFAGHIICPWDDNSDQSIVYAGGLAFDASGWTGRSGGLVLRKNADGTVDDITPTVVDGGTTYHLHPLFRWTLMVCPANRQRVIMCGFDDPPHYFTPHTMVSTNGGDSWFEITGVSGLQLYTFIGGDDCQLLYLWGVDATETYARIYFSPDFGATIQDKRGNIPTDFPAASRFVGIAGG